jgi:hypothetical protein
MLRGSAPFPLKRLSLLMIPTGVLLGQLWRRFVESNSFFRKNHAPLRAG